MWTQQLSRFVAGVAVLCLALPAASQPDALEWGEPGALEWGEEGDGQWRQGQGALEWGEGGALEWGDDDEAEPGESAEVWRGGDAWLPAAPGGRVVAEPEPQIYIENYVEEGDANGGAESAGPQEVAPRIQGYAGRAVPPKYGDETSGTQTVNSNAAEVADADAPGATPHPENTPGERGQPQSPRQATPQAREAQEEAARQPQSALPPGYNSTVE